MFGTKSGTTLRSGPRRAEFFIFRVHRDIKSNDLTEYIENEHASMCDDNSSTFKVSELERESRDDAPAHYYRLLVEGTDFSPLLNPDFWSDGIGCRPYYRRKKRAEEPNPPSYYG